MSAVNFANLCIANISFKTFFAKITVPISPKFTTKYLWVIGILVYLKEGPQAFPIRDNYEIAKIQ